MPAASVHMQGVHAAGSRWNHAFAGDDWDGVDASGKPWVCKTGTKQSPLAFAHLAQGNIHGSMLYLVTSTQL